MGPSALDRRFSRPSFKQMIPNPGGVPFMRKNTFPHIAAALSVLLLAAMTAPVFASTGTSDAAQAQTGVYEGYAMVILTDPPLADWPGAARARNGKLDFTDGVNGRYRAALAQAR